MDDQRKGLPSASAMWRNAKCSGSQALVNAVRDRGLPLPAPTPEMAAGTRIHSRLAGEGGELSNAEQEAYSALKEAQLKAIVAWNKEGPPLFLEELVEQRLWFHLGLEPLFSGQPDYIRIEGSRALVLNYKSGWNEVPPAADNLQLRAEIVLLKANRPLLTRIDGQILALHRPDFDRVSYGASELYRAQAEILAIVNRSVKQPDIRIPGAWCALCPAQAYCQEALEVARATLPLEERISVRELPRGEEGARLYTWIGQAKKLLALLEQTYEQILETEPDALPGFILPARGKSRRIVPYPERLKIALSAFLTPEEIDGCATYRVAKIEELLGIKYKLSGAELKRQFASLAGDSIEVLHDKPSIRALTRKEKASSELTNGI